MLTCLDSCFDIYASTW